MRDVLDRGVSGGWVPRLSCQLSYKTPDDGWEYCGEFFGKTKEGKALPPQLLVFIVL